MGFLVADEGVGSRLELARINDVTEDELKLKAKQVVEAISGLATPA